MGEWIPGGDDSVRGSITVNILNPRDSANAGDPLEIVTQEMYPDRGKSSPKIAHGIRIDPSKKMVLFRVIAMPE